MGIQVNYEGLVYVYKDLEDLRRGISEDRGFNAMATYAEVIVDPAAKKVVKSRDHNLENINIALSYPVESLKYYRDLLK